MTSFLPKEHAAGIATGIKLIRSTEGEKGQQIENVANWQQARNTLAPSGETSHSHMADSDEVAEPEVRDGHGLGYLQQTARDRKNVSAALMEALKTHSLGRLVIRLMMWVGGTDGICSAEVVFGPTHSLRIVGHENLLGGVHAKEERAV